MSSTPSASVNLAMRSLFDRFIDTFLCRVHNQEVAHLRYVRQIDCHVYWNFKFENAWVLMGGHPQAFKAMLSVNDRSLPPPVRLIQLARESVERWGGSLDSDSEAGSGYRFTLRLRKC